MRHPRDVLVLAIALVSLAFAVPARADHFSLFGGYGVGSFAAGGPGQPNSHRFAGVSFLVPGDRLELRLFGGTLERTDLPIPKDNDADYVAVDVVASHRWTGLPFDVGVGVGRYYQAFPEGYPNRLGRRVRLDKEGVNLTLKRELPLIRHLAGLAEVDAHYVPFARGELFVIADLGLSLRF
jgi:opacity protein-like surface antigen